MIVWLLRILTGATFLLSGFAKGIDPYGTLYKLREYAEAVGISLADSLLLTGSILLSGFEFMLGLFLLLGCYRRMAPRLSLAFMLVMLGLTFWIAVWNPVSDCGCFGDAVHLSNWATFIKNIILTACLLYLVRKNRTQTSLVTPYLQWLAFLGGGFYITGVSLYGYELQPMLDFRPFGTGTRLVAESSGAEDPEYRFIYRRGKDQVEVGADEEQPSSEDGWEFVERREVLREGVSKGSDKEENDSFRIYDREDGEDMTETVLISPEKTLALMIPEPERVSRAEVWRINALLGEGRREGMETVAVMGPLSESQYEMWSSNLGDLSPIYEAEDTSIKMIVRGNPGVIYLENGRIIWKSTLRGMSIPDNSEDDEIYRAQLEECDYHEAPRNDSMVLKISTIILVSWIGVLVLMTLGSRNTGRWFSRKTDKSLTRSDKVLPEEK